MAEIDEIKKDAETYAAIDIGSNAVRLLIKQLESDTRPLFSKALLLRVPLRLGFDVFADGRISPKKEKDMVRLMKCYKQLMKIYGVDDYRACATSAMRDAENGQSIIRTVYEKTGIRIEIIDGQEEARMVYSNHIETMRGRKGNFMFVDVGGGSTEITLIRRGVKESAYSYNIGTLRMLHRSEDVNDAELERISADMKAFGGECGHPVNIIGSGGNINKLFKLVRGRDSRYSRMSVASLQELYDKLKDMTVEERMEEYALKPDRADVIVPAGKIFLTIASITGASYIYVPVIGLADGIIDGLYSRNRQNLE